MNFFKLVKLTNKQIKFNKQNILNINKIPNKLFFSNLATLTRVFIIY